jgi:hypothetical protein
MKLFSEQMRRSKAYELRVRIRAKDASVANIGMMRSRIRESVRRLSRPMTSVLKSVAENSAR